MTQIVNTRAGGYEVLQVQEAPDPSPGPNEVVVDVRATGLNFADVIARMGKYPDAPALPCVMGYEVAGEVRSVGEGVTSCARGDRVFGLTRFGGHSSRVAVPESQIFAIPQQMSYSQAASLPVNYFTAYLAVVRFGNLQPDERILIHNAGGGVGVAAIQLSRQIGAEIYGTASGWKHERLKELGAAHTVDYRTADWVTEVSRLTGGKGVHVIIDPVGGKNLARDLEVLAPLGRLSAFGLSEPMKRGNRPLLSTLKSVLSMPRPHFLKLLNRNWMVGGLNLGHLWSEIDRLRPVAESVLASWRQGFVQPVIAAEIGFSQVAEAHRMLQERRNIGKVVLIPEG